MKFNTNLLKGFEEDKKDIVKYILFSIEQDTRLDDVLVNKKTISGLQSQLSWEDSILGDIQDIILKLQKEGSIKENDYESANSRWKLLRPLYVTELTNYDLSDDFIAECRKPFTKGYCGVDYRNALKKTVRQHLQIFIENNPEVKVELIPEVLKYMVDERIKENKEHVPMILNFIDALQVEGKENKNLLLTYEEYESGVSKTSEFI